MKSIVLTLPIPDRAVSQNATRGHSRIAAILKGKKVKEHRITACQAMMIAISRGMLLGAGAPIGYSLVHYFKHESWIRDEDNADGACKAYRDGICDALKINDKHFIKRRLSERLIDKAHPRVEITVYFND